MILETLQADPSSDLDFEIKGEGIPFLDFGWKTLDPFDPAIFNANYLAVEEFAQKFPEVQRVVLAKSDGNFSQLIASSEIFEKRLEESDQNRELFSALLFSEYLHRLASALPMGTEPMILFSLEEDLEKILLLCKRRFEHFQLVFDGWVPPIEGDQEVIVSLPQDERFDQTSLEQILLEVGDRPYKCIPEELLNEHWDEVEEIWIDPATIGDMGNRMLLGFEAAGGEIKKAKS